MEWTVLLCLLCVQVCVLTSTSLQAPHRAPLAEEGIHDNKNTKEVLDELWNQVEAVTDAPFPVVGGCKRRPGGCSPLAPNQSSRIKRQTRRRNRRPRSRLGSGSLIGCRPSDTQWSGCLSRLSVRQNSRTKRQKKKRPRTRPGSSSALRPGPPAPTSQILSR